MSLYSRHSDEWFAIHAKVYEAKRAQGVRPSLAQGAACNAASYAVGDHPEFESLYAATRAIFDLADAGVSA